jgi:hypothetical protein
VCRFIAPDTWATPLEIESSPELVASPEARESDPESTAEALEKVIEPDLTAVFVSSNTAPLDSSPDPVDKLIAPEEPALFPELAEICEPAKPRDPDVCASPVEIVTRPDVSLASET